MDDRPMNVRAPEFKEELIKLCKKYRIEIIPTMASTPGAIIAQLRFVDVNNQEELKKYGLEMKDNNDNSSSLLTN